MDGVTGPMSAAYMHLGEMWSSVNLNVPGDKIYYTDKTSDTFEVIDGVSWHEFEQSMEQDRVAELWPTLNITERGLGLAQGADFQARTKHNRCLVEKGRMREAGALTSTITGALWSPPRLIESGIVQPDSPEASCPLCGKHGADGGHLSWECTKVQAHAHPDIQKINRYCRECMRSNSENNKCWYWLGIRGMD